MYKIGIIGNGFVGNAVAKGFSKEFNYQAEIRIYDKNPSLSLHTLDETINQSEFIFLSVPTPSRKSGDIDISIVDNALNEISNIKSKDSIILLRSTVVPGTSRNFQEKYKNLNIVFNPEFLTEKNAVLDFVSQERAIFGGENADVSKVEKLFRHRFGDELEIIKTDYETAELTKYMNNLFLATKVSFLNEMKILADSENIDWNTAVKGFTLDSRVGKSHNNVPGHDGKFGFGGSCFPKDIQALINFANKKGITMNVIEGAWKANLKVRPEKDWEQLLGRAISEDEK